MSTLDELEYYCREENVYGALMFVGGWGSGKTYLIENVLAKILENEYIFMLEILYLIFDYPHKHYTFKYFEV